MRTIGLKQINLISSQARGKYEAFRSRTGTELIHGPTPGAIPSKANGRVAIALLYVFEGSTKQRLLCTFFGRFSKIRSGSPLKRQIVPIRAIPARTAMNYTIVGSAHIFQGIERPDVSIRRCFIPSAHRPRLIVFGVQQFEGTIQLGSDNILLIGRCRKEHKTRKRVNTFD